MAAWRIKAIMLKKARVPFVIWAVFLTLVVAAPVSAEQEISYDPYTSTLKNPEHYDPNVRADKDRAEFYARILELPLRPVEYTVGETLEWVEENYIYDKTVWFFDELNTRGIYPSIHTSTDGGLWGPGLRIRIDQLLKMEQAYLKPEVSGSWVPNHEFVGSTVRLGAHYTLEAPETTAFYHEGNFKYFRSSSESFFGIGHDTSLGDWTTYQPEETRLEALLGYHLTETVNSHASFVYQHMNIGNGNRERVGKIKERFGGSVPGIEGGNLIGLESVLRHDTRDHEHDAKRGGYEQLEFSYFHDTDGSDFHYLTVGGSVAHFFSILSDRRVLALRLAAEKNQELGGGRVPFFNMSRLGGTKNYIHSELLRSFRANRFYDEGLIVLNAEYRYRIYEYGNLIGEAFALADVGEVFDEISDFEFSQLDVSYGGGINLKFRRKTLISLVIARGSEGMRVVLGRNTSF